MTDSNVLRGALKSKIIWWNTLLAVLASLELMASHLTILFGQSVAASILLIGALTNVVLRTVTTQALEDK